MHGQMVLKLWYIDSFKEDKDIGLVKKTIHNLFGKIVYNY